MSAVPAFLVVGLLFVILAYQFATSLRQLWRGTPAWFGLALVLLLLVLLLLTPLNSQQLTAVFEQAQR